MSRNGWALVFGALIAGCDVEVGGSTAVDDAPVEGGITWYDDVAPVLIEKCGSCHRDGGVAPFSVETYEDAVPWGEAMFDAVESGRMPPFFAQEDADCTPPVGFRDDTRLTVEEKALVAEWIEIGKPEGNAALAATMSAPEIDDVLAPNTVVRLQEPFAVGGDKDIYQCFRIEVPKDSDVWLTELQVLPDNDLVVHHVLVWDDPDNLSADRVGPDGSYACGGDPGFWPTQLVAAWTPGGSPMRTPPDTGTLFKAGSSLVVNVHYHPTNDTTELDQSQFALKWTTEKPANYVTWYLVDIPFGAEVLDGPNDEEYGREFYIPAGVEDHVETVVLDTGSYLPWDLDIFAITPHMHYLGTDMQVTIRSEDPADDTCLIHTPNYRFDFQTSYFYDADRASMPKVGPGDKVEVRCTYNNSWSNPFMEDQLDALGISEPEGVWWGEQTGDEMCMAMVGFILPPIDLSEWL